MENLKLKKLNYNFNRRSESKAHWLINTAQNIFYANTDLSKIITNEK